MVGERKFRGQNKAPAWHRADDQAMSVIRLPLDVSDPGAKRQVEHLFSAAFQVRRAVQCAARARTRAFWRAHRERARHGPAVVRDRVGLSKTDFERTAWRCLDEAPHLRRHLTKALAMYQADNVWESTSRHLFGDASGRRHGPPGPGRWTSFTTIFGGAKSHTRAHKWETFRLHGTLAGHRAAYRHGQPRRLRPITPTGPATPGSTAGPVRSWWDHTGAFALVMTGLGAGELVVGVRVPQGPTKQGFVEHFLADPEVWHKVDLIRHQDAGAPGGWRYEAHLLVLKEGYQSPTTVTRREAAVGIARRGGIDVNVSNITVVSVPAEPSAADLTANARIVVSRVAADADELARSARRRAVERRRQKHLDRSRRANNAAQYEKSGHQQARYTRRAERVRHVGGIDGRSFRAPTTTTQAAPLETRDAAVMWERLCDPTCLPSIPPGAGWVSAGLAASAQLVLLAPRRRAPVRANSSSSV